MAKLTSSDKEEVKILWLDKCWTMREIADWLGVNTSVISRCVKRISINSDEFQEKEAEIAEFLSNSCGRNTIATLGKKRKERLEKAYYGSSRFTR